MQGLNKEEACKLALEAVGALAARAEPAREPPAPRELEADADAVAEPDADVDADAESEPEPDDEPALQRLRELQLPDKVCTASRVALGAFGSIRCDGHRVMCAIICLITPYPIVLRDESPFCFGLSHP